MKRLILCLLVLLMTAASAFADPLPLLEDYAEDFVLQHDENDPSPGRFEYSFRYPHADENAEGGADINVFYEDLILYTDSFTIPMNMDACPDADYIIRIGYTVTCNNDDYFSVLIETSKSSPEQDLVFWEGHVFSRKNGSPGLTYTLPKLLGILNETESDTWLQDRQTAKADSLLVDMVWDMIEENEGGIDYYSDLTKDELTEIFFPEQDFYLDEAGNPVFFLQPGMVAPETAGLITFPISLEDILDEM